MSYVHKFPKSANDIQCISKCYNKKTNMTHPLTLEEMTNIYHPFCAIAPTLINGETHVIDQCNSPSDKKYDVDDDDQLITQNDKMDLLYPIIEFNAKEFLRKYYKINDISDFYILLKNNKSLPIFTKLRLIDCFINVFGKNITITEEIFSETIIDIIKKFWIKKMYGKLCKYIGVEKNDGVFINPKKNNIEKSENVGIRTKFIIANLITTKLIFEISNNYFTGIVTRRAIGIDDFYDFLTIALEEKIKTFN